MGLWPVLEPELGSANNGQLPASARMRAGGPALSPATTTVRFPGASTTASPGGTEIAVFSSTPRLLWFPQRRALAMRGSPNSRLSWAGPAPAAISNSTISAPGSAPDARPAYAISPNQVRIFGD